MTSMLAGPRRYDPLNDPYIIHTTNRDDEGLVLATCPWCKCHKDDEYSPTETKRYGLLPWLPLTTSGNWVVCAYCRMPPKDHLTECPNCRRLWRGPRPNFPFALECPSCE